MESLYRDADDALLAAMDYAIAHRRRGFPGRLHLTPLDAYAASEQYPDDVQSTDIPKANWQCRDDDPGMTQDLFLTRHNGRVYNYSRRALRLLDTADGTLPQPPGHKKPSPAFGLYKGWRLINRRHSAETLCVLDDVRNPLLMVTEQRRNGCFGEYSTTTAKYPNYWELVKEVFALPGRDTAKLWVLAAAVEGELDADDPARDLLNPCFGFALDCTARTMEITEGADALEMYAAILRL